jgi:TolB protein
MVNRFVVIVVIIFITFNMGVSQKDVYMRIQAEGFEPILISIPPFMSTIPNELSYLIREVVINDLELSGFFRVFEKEFNVAQDDSSIIFVPSARFEGNIDFSTNSITCKSRLTEVTSNTTIFNKKFDAPLRSFRQLAHRIANEIVYFLTGEKGIANTKISYVSANKKSKEIYITDYDGYGIQKMTFTNSLNLSPTFSPDGKKIVFTSYFENNPDLFQLDLSKGKLSKLSSNRGLHSAPSWSPEGKNIAFALTKNGNTDIHLMDTRSKKLRQLTNNPGIDSSPTWSPNGREIAFTSDRSGRPQIYLMDAEGGNVRRLTYVGDYNDSPAWSPRGDLIAYVSRDDGLFNIYTIDVSGEQLRQLTKNSGSNENPSWSPEGLKIAFSSNRSGNWEIYVMNWDGTQNRRLTTTGGNLSPCWSPYFN